MADEAPQKHVEKHRALNAMGGLAPGRPGYFPRATGFPQSLCCALRVQTQSFHLEYGQYYLSGSTIYLYKHLLDWCV